MVKFAALLILGSLSLVLLTSGMIIVPTSLGRAVFSLIMWITTFSIGTNGNLSNHIVKVAFDSAESSIIFLVL